MSSCPIRQMVNRSARGQSHGLADSQSVSRRGKRGACIDLSGHAGKKIKGKKRQPSYAFAHAIEPQTNGVAMSGSIGRFPFLKEQIRRRIHGRYPRAEENLAPLGNCGKRRHATSLEVIQCRWIVERRFAYLGRCRRLAKLVRTWQNSRDLPTLGVNSPHAEKTMCHINFSDGLSGSCDIHGNAGFLAVEPTFCTHLC